VVIALIARGMNEEKINVIIETFADYVENYYDEDNEAVDVPNIVNQHFDEFVQWAYDDFVINELEYETLTNRKDPDLNERIRMEVVNEFLLILCSEHIPR
jgi:hypothetical protein